MKKLKITMLGAGSGFVMSVAKELITHEIFNGCEFVLQDISEERLLAAEDVVSGILKSSKKIKVSQKATTDRKIALDGCDYVITSCEMSRYANWVKDLRIPAKYGAHQVQGENGGPGGMIHAMRNICMFREILADMEKLCPGAWLMNFTNPMSVLCTYFKNYSPVKALGFCHQVHGSFGVIAEQLGMQPGELEVISGGINHLNWLFDIRKKGTRESCMQEFLDKVRKSKYWKKRFDSVPPQMFTLETLNTFNMYPVGYDDHIIEYLPFFWEEFEWKAHQYESLAGDYEKLATRKTHQLEMQRLLGRTYTKPPFPVNPDHPYYAEKPCQVILALETNTPAYFDAINIVNHGAISNLPPDAILDVPGIVVGGQVRSIYVGELPIGPQEICRRQITLHEMIAKATHEGNDNLAVQTLCLDPYVRSLSQARNIWSDFRKEYKDYLTTFTGKDKKN
jgi:alpha-galactosidase